MWLFRCHCCSGPDRTYKYFPLLLVTYKEEDEEYTKDLCKNCFLQTEESNATRSHQPLKAYQPERMTRGTVEISRGMRRITLEVVRTFQQERTRATKFLRKAAGVQVRGGINCV